MIAAVDQFNFLESLYRPIIIGPIVGAIMGDLQIGLIVGGSYELMMIGAMPVGGAQPPNAVIGGIMATVFAIQSGLDVSAALPLAIPMSIPAPRPVNTAIPAPIAIIVPIMKISFSV